MDNLIHCAERRAVSCSVFGIKYNRLLNTDYRLLITDN